MSEEKYMNTNLLTYNVLNNDGKQVAKYCIFETDKDNYQEIINNFACSRDGLIPQPWFGNITDPKIIILGINPSFHNEGNPNDITDNNPYYKGNIRNHLINNLITNNRSNDYNSIDWLLNSNNNSFLSSFWKDFFNDVKINLSEVGIFNYYPYYCKGGSSLTKTICKSKSLDLIEKILNKKNQDRMIIYLWKGSKYFWEKELKKHKLDKKVFFADYGENGKPKFPKIKMAHNEN